MLGLFRRRKKSQHQTLVEDALLVRYLKPSALPSEYAQKDWEGVLGKRYERAVQDAVKSGLLRRPTVREALQLARVKDIKPVLRELDLKVSGRKAELVERLIESAPDAAMKLATERAQAVYVATDAGRERAHRFEEQKQRREGAAEEKVREALRKGNVRAACDAVNEFYRWLPANMRPGMGIDWENPEGGMHLYARRVRYILEGARESWVVKDLPRELRETVVLYAAEDTLWPEAIPTETLDTLDRRAEELGESIEPYRRLRTIQGWAIQKDHEERYAEMDLSVAYGPPAHLGCRCLSVAELLPNHDSVVLWRTSNDHLVCTDTLSVPWGTVAGCADLADRVVSNGPYLGMTLNEARERAKRTE